MITLVANGSELPLKGFPRTLAHQLWGFGYDGGDPYGEFLPPPVEVNADGDSEFMRAVVVVTEETQKGTARSPQKYVNPLQVLSGREYASISFVELHAKSATPYGAKVHRLWHSRLHLMAAFSSSCLTGGSSTLGSDELQLRRRERR